MIFDPKLPFFSLEARSCAWESRYNLSWPSLKRVLLTRKDVTLEELESFDGEGHAFLQYQDNH